MNKPRRVVRRQVGLTALQTLVALAGAAIATLGAAPASALALEPDDRATAPANAARTLSGALPINPRLTRGELPNGLRYIVLRHANPPGRANIWLHVSSGSLNETDKQRGIAHYLEHMAFNGSKQFPPGTVVPLFESLGLTFGRHQNAFTSFDQTTYQLSLQDTSDEKMDKALAFMSDVAFGLLLDPAEIDEERGIILEEKRSRLSARQRVQEEYLRQIAPGSSIGERLPIGTEETILGVQREDFVAYYSKYYVPSNMTLMIAADMDERALVEKLTPHFSAGTKAPAPSDLATNLSPTVGVRGVILTDPELTDASIEMVRVSAPDAPTTTYEIARTRLVESIGAAAFNRRIDAKVNEGTLKSLSGGASSGTQFGAARFTSVSFDVRPDQWRTGLSELGTELRRGVLHGFSQREIDAVKAEILADAQRAVKQESSLPARAVMGGMNSAIARGEALTSAAQDLEMIESFLPTITREEVGATFASIYGASGSVFFLQGPSTMDVPSASELASLGEEALRVSPPADAESAAATTLLSKAPAPVTFDTPSVHAASDVASTWMSSGTLAHHKFMDIRKDAVTVSINLARGTINTASMQERAIAEAAGLAWSQPATSTLTSTMIRDLMTGKNATVRGGVGTDIMSLTVSGTPADIEEGLKLAHLLLTDPKIEATALEQWKTRQLEQIALRDKNPQMAFMVAMTEAIYPTNDARTQLLTKEAVEGVTLEAAQAWLRSALSKAEMEVAVVGDIDRDRALNLLATYVGSTGQRERISASTLDELRTLPRPTGPIISHKTVATTTPQAMVLGGFFTADAENVADNRAMQIASQSVSSRMVKILRERDQLVYSIRASNGAGTTWPGFGTFAAAAPTEAGKVAALAAGIKAIYDEFAQTGPTEDEMSKAKLQIANTLDESMKDPGFWVSRLGTLTYRNVNLDDVVGANDAYQAMSAETVREAFIRYYTPESFMILSMRPEGTDMGQAPAQEPATTGTSSISTQ